MDVGKLAEERNAAGSLDPAGDALVVSVSIVPEPYVPDRLLRYADVVTALVDAIPRLADSAPPPHLAHRGRFGFVSPFGLRKTGDGLAGGGFRFWNDGGMRVAVRYPGVSDETHVPLLREGLFYAVLHVAAALHELLGDGFDRLHVHASTGTFPGWPDPPVRESATVSLPALGVAEAAYLADVLAARLTFPDDLDPSPFSDAAVQDSLRAAIAPRAS